MTTDYRARVAARPASPWGSPERPLAVERAEGCRIRMSDGREYIDLMNGKGAVILGHNHPAVEAAIVAQLQSHASCATGWSPCTAELAERICRRTGIADARLVFFSTGTEGVRAAVALARRATGRRLVLSAGYHGWDPMWSPAAGLLSPSADGIIDFFFLPDLLEQALARHRGEIAAVVIAPDYAYLRRDTLARLAELARSHEVLICCDDVKQGFRRRAGSEWPEATGRDADLYVFSKGLANGQRLSCVVGRRELLDHARNFTYTAYFDVVPIVAALATLREMEQQSGHALLVARGLRLIERLSERFRAAGLPAEVRGAGPLFQFVFASAALEDAFHRECLAAGLLLFEGDNQALSLAIDDREADALVERFDVVCDRLRATHGRRGGEIGPERVFGAAWNMIDGATDQVPVADALAWIRREMGWA